MKPYTRISLLTAAKDAAVRSKTEREVGMNNRTESIVLSCALAAGLLCGCGASVGTDGTAAAAETAQAAQTIAAPSVAAQAQTTASIGTEESGTEPGTDNAASSEVTADAGSSVDETYEMMQSASSWNGYYFADNGQSMSIFDDMGTREDLWLVSCNEEGWTDREYSLNVSADEPETASFDLGDGHTATLTRDGNSIILESDGGLFMDGTYTAGEEPTDSSVNARGGSGTAGSSSDYSVAVSGDAATVEQFARDVRIEFLHEDWEALLSKMQYPIRIGDITWSAQQQLRDALSDGSVVFGDDFLNELRQEKCAGMFANSDGIMMGEKGAVWFSEILSDDGTTSQGLKITAVNHPD